MKYLLFVIGLLVGCANKPPVSTTPAGYENSYWYEDESTGAKSPPMAFTGATRQVYEFSDLHFQTNTTAADRSIPQPTWVQDPSAGHYDCPDGWTAYSRAEPYPPNDGPFAAVYYAPTKDAKGHVLQDQPKPGICVKDK